MLSFSQNSEDVVLARLLSGVDQGRYIDIGAGHPINDSVTKYFYDRGWTGINIEPDERYFSQLVLNRPKDQNIQVCVSPEKGDVDFWVTKILGWSTSSTEVQRDLPPEELFCACFFCYVFYK